MSAATRKLRQDRISANTFQQKRNITWKIKKSIKKDTCKWLDDQLKDLEALNEKGDIKGVHERLHHIAGKPKQNIHPQHETVDQLLLEWHAFGANKFKKKVMEQEALKFSIPCQS